MKRDIQTRIEKLEAVVDNLAVVRNISPDERAFLQKIAPEVAKRVVNRVVNGPPVDPDEMQRVIDEAVEEVEIAQDATEDARGESQEAREVVKTPEADNHS